MARRSKSTEVAPEATEENSAPVEEAQTDQTEQEQAATDEPAIDLSAFQAAANEAVASGDESTGELPEAAISPVNEAYRNLDGLKAKNAARAWLDESMKSALVQEKNYIKARSFIDLKEKLSAGSSRSTQPRTPADPTEAFVQKVAALQLGLTEVTSNVPEGVDSNWNEKVTQLIGEVSDQLKSYRDWNNDESEDKGDAPEVHPVVRKAFQLSRGKVARVGGGATRDPNAPRRDVIRHIKEAFADQPVGAFLTIGEISKFRSNEYGDDRPSPGAISARLFPSGKPALEVDGIRGTAEEGRPRGATKVA